MGSVIHKLFSSFEAEPSRAIMLGLDSAGKTTVLYQLKLGEQVKTIPTIGFNVEKVTICKGLTMAVWDVGGQDKLRQLWKHYYQDATGMIFVVDSSDRLRLKEAQMELTQVVQDAHIHKNLIPVIILANKQDMPSAVAVRTIQTEMSLDEVLSNHPWTIHGCCATKGDGIPAAMKKFAEMLKEDRKKKKNLN